MTFGTDNLGHPQSETSDTSQVMIIKLVFCISQSRPSWILVNLGQMYQSNNMFNEFLDIINMGFDTRFEYMAVLIWQI